MTEIGSPLETNEQFKNDPFAVIAEHLSHVDTPTPQAVDYAAQLINRKALRSCMDLTNKASNATDTLASMFAVGHEALPDHWKTNPEITRTVLSMCGELEAGYVRASILDQSHLGGNPQLEVRLGEVERFVQLLQEK